MSDRWIDEDGELRFGDAWEGDASWPEELAGPEYQMYRDAAAHGVCPLCHGSGALTQEGAHSVCPLCNGSGMLEQGGAHE